MTTHYRQRLSAIRTANTLRRCTEAEISAYLNARIDEADRHLEGDEHTLALDSIARLVTVLREKGLWPGRSVPPGCA